MAQLSNSTIVNIKLPTKYVPTDPTRLRLGIIGSNSRHEIGLVMEWAVLESPVGYPNISLEERAMQVQNSEECPAIGLRARKYEADH